MTAASSAPYSLLVKPAGAACNLACSYCFYLEKAHLYPETRQPRMSLETAERMIRGYFATPQPVYSFGWQGGEPTLMGVDFFREVFALQRRLAPPGASIANGFQTNGTLLDEQWIDLFREHDVLVGLSIDGPAEMHDSSRPRAGGAAGSHAAVEEAARRLRAGRVAFNALTVVGAHNVEHPLDVYDYLRSLRIRHLQFIPLVDFSDDGSLRSHSVTGSAWGAFLIAIHERWFPGEVRRVSIRHVDSLIWYLVRGEHNVCVHGSACGGHLVVEHTGDLFPCDFYVQPELCLGSVADPDVFGRVADDPRVRAFVAQKRPDAEECRSCETRDLCGGDCPRNRVNGGKSSLCDGWRAYWNRALPDLERLARSVPA